MSFWMSDPRHCSANVTRNHEDDACGKEAVAVAVWEEGDERVEYPVCKHHARGRQMLPLAALIDIARD